MYIRCPNRSNRKNVLTLQTSRACLLAFCWCISGRTVANATEGDEGEVIPGMFSAPVSVARPQGGSTLTRIHAHGGHEWVNLLARV